MFLFNLFIAEHPKNPTILRKISYIALYLVLLFQVVSQFLQFTLQLTSAVFCGHLGEVYLDAIALGNLVSALEVLHITGMMHCLCGIYSHWLATFMCKAL